MKLSKIEHAWLPTPPESWQVVPAWSLFTEGTDGYLPSDPHLIPSRLHGVVTQEEYTELTGLRPMSNDKAALVMKHVDPDDFVISMGSHEGGIEHSSVRGKVSNDYRVLKPAKEVVPGYFRWFFKSRPLIEGLARLTNEVRVGQRIHYSKFATLWLPLPNTSTQQRIAKYLDRETGAIDAMIARMNELARALSERRKRAIAHLVTGQDNSEEQLLDEATWQGRVPKRWQQVRLGMFLFPTEEKVGRGWAKTQLLSLTRRGIITRDPDSGEGKFPASFEQYQLVYPGDLVMCLFDVDETPRTVARSNLQGMITNAYTRFVVDESIANSRFLEWALIAVDDVKGLRPLYSGLRKTVRKPVLLNERFYLPALDEQKQIADRLDEMTSRTDQMIAKVAELKFLLTERRAALIADVVTGRKEVA